MRRHEALLRTDDSEERIASMFRLDRISELETELILSALIMDAISSSETSVLTRATRRHITEDGILHGTKIAFHIAIFPFLEV
jgi:hypothetical protein